MVASGSLPAYPRRPARRSRSHGPRRTHPSRARRRARRATPPSRPRRARAEARRRSRSHGRSDPRPARRATADEVARRGATQLAEAGQAGRKRVGPFIGHGAQAETIEDGVGVAARVRTQVVSPSAPDLGRDEDVLAHAEASEHLELLKRARDAEARRRRGVSCVMSRPSSVSVPLLTSCSPVIALKIVVLPAPFGPMSPVTQPRSTSRSTSFTAL